MTSYCMNPKDFDKIRKIPGNMECIDCGVSKPDWGSPKLGILFCFQCSGRHRGLGTHISFVRSVTMDSWTDKQIQQMLIGGNNNCKEFLSQHGVNVSTETPIREKYDSPAAELYRQVLLARVEGRPEPTGVTQPTTTTNNTGPTTAAANSASSSTGRPVVDPSRLTGFGSSPPPEPKPAVNTKVAIATTAAVAVGTAAVYLFSSF